MRLRSRIALVLLCVCAFSSMAQTVTPIIDCWYEDTSKGILTVAFGYINSGASTETYPLGVLNFVGPTLADYGQPVSFSPGTAHNVFRMAVPVADEAGVSWTVNGTTVLLNRGGIASTCTDCSCPPGDIGSQGPTGPTGPQGLQGPMGPAGVTGISGPTGTAGPSGAMGPAGPSGSTGAAGSIGPDGVAGPVGPDGPEGAGGIAGAEGPAGPTGATGPAGPVGIAGATGPQGIAGDEGPIGATGAFGPVGIAGPTGGTGPVGPAGAMGGTGPLGPAGAEGPAGIEGPRGQAGHRGPRGPQGESGVDGPAGVVGPAGVSGPLGKEGLLPILESLSLSANTEVVIERPADVIVLGSVAARSPGGGVVRVRVAGESFFVRVPAGGEWLSVPLSAGKRLRAGRWNVELIAGDGVEVRQPSITVLVEPIEQGTSRRRAVDH